MYIYFMSEYPPYMHGFHFVIWQKEHPLLRQVCGLQLKCLRNWDTNKIYMKVYQKKTVGGQSV